MPESLTHRRESTFLQVTFRSDLLLHLLEVGGVDAWNSWLGWMKTHQLIDAVWLEGEQQPVVGFNLDFSNIDLSGRHLPGIDLSMADCTGGCFRHSCLQECRFSMVAGASFEGSDLMGAQLAMADIAGCDFVSCNLSHASFGMASYPMNRPPKGLPQEVLQTCSLQGPDHEPRIHLRRRYPSLVVSANLIIPFRRTITSS